MTKDSVSSAGVCPPVGVQVSTGSSSRSSHKAAKDFYANDTNAIENKAYESLPEVYPSLCFCDPAGDIKPCIFCPAGHRGRLPVRRKLLWVWPLFGWMALKYHKSGYMKKFYIDDYPKANLGIIAFVSVLSVLVDAFTDPVMAKWTDRCTSRLGRRRPFLIVAAFYVPIVFILSWTPVVPSGVAASVWFGVFHVGFKLADTLFLIPFDAYGAQLTPMYNERATVWAWRELSATLGILFGMAIAPLLFVDEQCSSTPDTGCTQHPLVATFFGLLFCHGCLNLSYFGKDPPLSSFGHSRVSTFGAEAGPKQSKFSDADTIPALVSTALNAPFRCLLVSSIVKAVGQDVPFNVLPFMASYVIGEKCLPETRLIGVILALNLICSCCSLAFWVWISRKYGKYAAHMCFHVLLLLASLPFVFVSPDTGDCSKTYMTFGFAAFFGFAYGGSFILNDLVCTTIDYDELLMGGRRREANYLMAVDFVPKFMNIPGECVPFLLMAYLKYNSSPLEQPECPSVNGTTLSKDQLCAAFYTNEPIGKNLCSDKGRCADYLADGVSFVCRTARGTHGECGIQQNGDVVWLLRICFSLVPAAFIFCGIIALVYYPKKARNEASHEKLIQAISAVHRGESVADPWRPGSMVKPPMSKPGPNSGALSYFWPWELRAALTGATPGEVNYNALFKRPCMWSLFFATLIVPGSIVMVMGWDALTDKSGASATPLGLMLVGLGIVGVWFNALRAMAAIEVKKNGATHQELVMTLDRLCNFTGETPIESGDGDASMRAVASDGSAAPDSAPPCDSKGKEEQCPANASENSEGAAAGEDGGGIAKTTI